MRELSLFSGAGGGLLGTRLLGWEHYGYVEFNEYCQRIIRQRIEDGLLREAPIFSDIRAFISEGYADSYQGMVDVVTAGFPCQPFSVAGKQAGEDDPRNMWPQTIDVIRRVQPRFAFMENVPGLLAHPYARRIFGDLAESGFDVRWRVLSAAEVGAPHKRNRLWIVADSRERRFSCTGEREIQQSRGTETVGPGKELAHSQGKRCREAGEYCKRSQERPSCCREALAYTSGKRFQGPARKEFRCFHKKTGSFQGRESCGGNAKARRAWPIEPSVGRVANGVADRVDRIKALGNGQVSGVVATAWKLLSGA